jgi:hypothetical protein
MYAVREEVAEEEPERLHGPPGDLHAFGVLMDVIDYFITFSEAAERSAVTMGDALLGLPKQRRVSCHLTQRSGASQ